MSQEMQVPVEKDPTQESVECPAGGLARLKRVTGIAQARIPELVYDLRAGADCSDGFYAAAADFSDRLLAEIDLRAGEAIRRYSQFVQDERGESPRSLGEYSIELLTLSLALARYGEAAERAPRWAMGLARWLFWLRGRVAPIKPFADFQRAAITRRFLMWKIDPVPSRNDVGGSEETAAPGQSGSILKNRLPRLIEWLEATGDFEQEAMRLKNWLGFLDTLPQAEASWLIETAMDLFYWFEHEAECALGIYSRGIPMFLATEYRSRGCREDQIFCAKEPVEYHLNMVAAEIMNRGLRAEFEHMPHKVVLAPACMRGRNASSCQARTLGPDSECTGCTTDCAVNRLTVRMRGLGAKVLLVPHSSGFSRLLARWQREPDTGVTAVACLANILQGGYEMRVRGIRSQCVLLDYPGCRKHWRKKSCATDLNEERLVRIVGSASNP